jgi:hypothetical protein
MATYFLPSSNLFIVPYAWDIVKSTCLRCDECCLGNEQCPTDTSSLPVIIDSELVVNMILPCSETSER